MTDLVVQGGSVLTAGGLLAAADVVVRHGRIAELVDRAAPLRAPHAGRGRRDDGSSGPAAVLDATGLVLAPGFVDLQCNGCGGIDLTAEPERMWDVAAMLPRWGVTAWLPTIVTSPEDVRERALATLREGRPAGASVAAPLGLHFEGPFLSPARKGAHTARDLRLPDLEAVEGWSHASGVALVTLAPELPGALDVLSALVDRDVVVSLGHSMATAAEAMLAVDAGARWATHLFNAMPPMHHRDPGLAGLALTDERLYVGVIADGLHMHPLMVRLAARALGSRLTLVTDAVSALGMPPGPIRFGDLEALSDGEGVRLPDGTLAGSSLSMSDAVANLMAFAGDGFAAAIDAATAAPARLLKIDHERGELSPGMVGDLVLLDVRTPGPGVGSRPETADLASRPPVSEVAVAVDVVATVVGGEVAYDRRIPSSSATPVPTTGMTEPASRSGR